MEAAVFVPSHAEVSKDIKELAGYNRDKVMEAALRLLDICRKPDVRSDPAGNISPI